MLALLPLLLGSLAGAPEESHYLDASLDLDGKLLSWRFVDLDADGTRELVLAIGTKDGARELRVHRFDAAGLGRVADTTIPVLPDVLAWGAADVREEPGRELLFLTKSGAFSYSPTIPGYKDNVRRLARAELIYDMPDPGTLPYWAYVIPAGDRDLVLLPGRSALTLWGPPRAREEESDAELTYALRATLRTDAIEVESAQLGANDRNRGDGPSISTLGPSPFLADAANGGTSLLEDAHATSAPAMLDVNGDGYLDLVFADAEQLRVHLGGSDGPAPEPSRVESLPEALRESEENEVELRLGDLDADGRLDLIAVVADEPDGFENRLHRVLIYRGTEERLMEDEPAQVLRFEAGDLEVRAADVDGDGRLDLTVEKLELPSLVGTVTGIEFTFRLLVFLGEERGFARRPAISREESFDEDSAVELAANRAWKLDCNGDGTADLVEIGLKGNITIQCLRTEKSRLRGSSYSLDPAPWKEFEVEGSIDSLTLEDFNGDGLGDVVSASDERLTVLLSVRAGGKR